jgi:hypothetical protein
MGVLSRGINDGILSLFQFRPGTVSRAIVINGSGRLIGSSRRMKYEQLLRFSPRNRTTARKHTARNSLEPRAAKLRQFAGSFDS